MTSKKIISLAIATFAIGCFAVGNVVLAVSPILASERQTQQTQERCDVGERLGKKIMSFNESKRKHVQAYNNMRDRIQKFINKMAEDGYDTTKLKADLLVMND